MSKDKKLSAESVAKAFYANGNENEFKKKAIELAMLKLETLIAQKCKAQREICADNAKVEMKLIRSPMFSSRQPRVVRDSIINAPEPT